MISYNELVQHVNNIDTIVLSHEERIHHAEEKPVIDSYLSNEVIQLCSVIVEMIDQGAQRPWTQRKR